MTKIVDTLVLDKSQQQKIKMDNIRKIIHLADLKVTAEFQEIKEYVRQYFNDNISPADHILYALRAASEYCCSVSAPFVIVNTKNNDVLVLDK